MKMQWLTGPSRTILALLQADDNYCNGISANANPVDRDEDHVSGKPVDIDNVNFPTRSHTSDFTDLEAQLRVMNDSARYNVANGSGPGLYSNQYTHNTQAGTPVARSDESYPQAEQQNNFGGHGYASYGRSQYGKY